MKVIDNFLSDEEFKDVSKVLMGDNFPWYFNSILTSEQRDKQFYFSNTLFCSSPPWNGKCAQFNVAQSILSHLKIETLYRIKTNCQPRTLFHRKSLYHIDYTCACFTAIFYVNTTNGWTEFKKGGKVKSVANRMLIFDSNLEHRGVSCTDQQTRVVINFNYE